MKQENLRKRFLVILADRKRARFFTIFLGSFEDSGEELAPEEVPQKIKAEGFRPGKISRHIREHLFSHLKNVGQKALEFLIKKRIYQLDGVFIGTHKELFSAVKNHLPVKLKQKVVGEFTIKPNNALGDITSKIITQFNL